MKNELSALENKETITSLELVKQINLFRNQENNKVELQHYTLLEIIRDEFSKEIADQKILGGSYKDKQNQERPMFELTFLQATQVLVRESKFVRKSIIEYIQKLESQIKDNHKLPTTYKDALLELVSKVEQIELLESENKIQEQIIEEFKPMKDYLDIILKDSESTLTITQIAADYGLSARALNALLHEQGLIRKVNDQWILYSDHMNKGYTKSETIEVLRKDGSRKTIINTKWLQKGRLKIHEILTNLGVKANEDKEAS